MDDKRSERCCGSRAWGCHSGYPRDSISGGRAAILSFPAVQCQAFTMVLSLPCVLYCSSIWRGNPISLSSLLKYPRLRDFIQKRNFTLLEVKSLCHVMCNEWDRIEHHTAGDWTFVPISIFVCNMILSHPNPKHLMRGLVLSIIVRLNFYSILFYFLR